MINYIINYKINYIIMLHWVHLLNGVIILFYIFAMQQYSSSFNFYIFCFCFVYRIFTVCVWFFTSTQRMLRQRNLFAI